jgi:hypothetical protein
MRTKIIVICLSALVTITATSNMGGADITLTADGTLDEKTSDL